MLIADYDAQVSAGEIAADPGQRAVALRLDDLARALQGYDGPVRRGLFPLRPRAASAPPRGLYVWGEVGRGKTMLMDLFFAAAPVARKRRVHFTAFMQDVHGRIHRVRQSGHSGDAVAPVARELAREAVLLCFDEFQVTDITDAMILGRLFAALFEAGVVVVATSNTPPKRLYLNGLNRQLFEPFIALIASRLEVVELGGGRDYRRGRPEGLRVYITPDGPGARAEMQAVWQQMTGVAHGAPEQLTVQGRTLAVPEAARGVARFGFAALCEAALGPADYLALARQYETVFVAGVPVFDAASRNAAKRFITLIDTLYDARRRVVITAAAAPGGLYPGVEEFRRTASRLEEMQAADWWAT